MVSEQDIAVEAIRIAVKIKDAHDEYEQAHSMQGQCTSQSEAAYVARVMD